VKTDAITRAFQPGEGIHKGESHGFMAFGTTDWETQTVRISYCWNIDILADLAEIIPTIV